MRPLSYLSAMGLSGVLLGSVSATAQTYSITDLGTPGQGNNFSESVGINQSGQAVGVAGYLIPGLIAADPTSAFVYSNGQTTELDFTPEGIAGDNRLGGDKAKLRITGLSGPYAVLYQDDLLRTLGTLPGDVSSVGFAVNSSGEVAGVSYAAEGAQKAFLYQNGNFINLGDFPGGAGAEALGINELGDVTGEAFFPNKNGHAFLYHEQTLTDLGTLPGTVSSVGEAINSSLQVTGQAYSADYTLQHAFLWSKGQMKDLGTLPGGTESQGYSINASGQVVGQSDSPVPNFPGDYLYHGFLYSNGKMYDLNSLIPANSGWVIQYASSINDKGEIAATGYSSSPSADGLTHVLLLQPAVTCCTGPAVKLTVKDGQGFFWDGGGAEYGRTALQVYQDNPSLAQNWVWQPVSGGFTICTLSTVCLADNGAQVTLGKKADVFVITQESAVLDTNSGRYIQNATKPANGTYLSTGPLASAWSFSLSLH